MNQEGLLFPKGTIRKKRKKHHKSIIDRDAKGQCFICGKTGYTEEAGLCLASLLSVGGREYILVTAGAPGSHETEPYHIEDALNAAGQLSA